MVYLFGWKAMSGMFFLLTLSFYYGIAGRWCEILRSKISDVADERVNLMNSIISGIRTVKMYAWEWSFMERVLQARSNEIKLIRWEAAILATFNTLYFSCNIIAAFISFATMALNGVHLNSYNTFMILSLLNSVKTGVSWTVARGAKELADFSKALCRIQDLLEYDYSSVQKFLHGAFADCKKVKYFKENKTSTISLHNVVCSWNGRWERPSLKSVSLTANKGDLAFITGPVGCGKSSIFYAILNEMLLLDGDITHHGKIAWISQQPWVFSGTVRENILFGETFDPKKYGKTLGACALQKDLERLPFGDMTRVGERGIVLSGGQRARVELARAVYFNADIYLLDDPLSAVDTKVGQHIFHNCISTLLHDKTRLMITHNFHVLKDAKNIVVMKNGETSLKGSFTTLLESDLNAVNRCPETKQLAQIKKESASTQDINKHETERWEDVTGLENAEEDLLAGSISWAIYWNYIRAGMSALTAGAMIMFFVLVQGFLILPDWWLLKVTSKSHDPQFQAKNLYIFGALGTAAFFLSFFRAALAMNFLVMSSKNLHHSMLTAVLRAPVLFFDTNPAGRVLNRFSRDIGIMDEILPFAFLDALLNSLYASGALVLPSVLNPWVTIPAIASVGVFLLMARYYLRSARDLRRLEAVNRSPVLSHFSETLEGLVHIRAFKKENRFLEVLYSYQDAHNKVCFAIISTTRWLGTQVDMLCIVFVVFVVFLAILTNNDSGPSALSIVYVLYLGIDTWQFTVIKCSEVENYMTSVERIITYTHLDQEPGYNTNHQPPDNWPQHGQVSINNLGLVYYEGGPKILKDLTFTIDRHEKIGIVGRTGAGKSSLVAALFRMPQPTGDVIIDGVNIADINIQRSRQAMAVITQNPVLFTASLRMNLDPFKEYQDKELWDVLEEAGLKPMVKKLPRQLSEEVGECGANFSVGERQLLCLARALLKRNKIIVMDEATANVDHKTDQLIQETIRTKFKDCTVIAIAHRLNTIIDYDRILFLENGRVVEFDKPTKLLENRAGQFSRLYHSHDIPGSEDDE
ncbi:ATP-binding cassette sub-family C member 4-like [Montipora capricornis]|uniref:ATP-binding cassette sub-family C member 4-like n=1 Tax=Montipora capricornis TaxID=246305 RepID=UPI0035F1543B